MSTSQILERLQTMVINLNQVNGTNEKIERLKKYNDLKDFLKLLYDPNRTTGVTSDQLKKFKQKLMSKSKPNTKQPVKKKAKIDSSSSSSSSSPSPSMSLIELLEKLYDRELSGNEAKETVLNFITQHSSYEDLIYKIINKDLETRVDVKQLNKAFPNLIVEFSVALANDFTKSANFFKKHAQETWYLSRKYDGVRCLVLIEDGKVKAFSRNGNRFPALKPLEQLLTPFAKLSLFNNMVLDGEICYVDKEGNEVFSESVSRVKRKSVLMEQYRYYAFDALTMQNFLSGESDDILSQRQVRLAEMVGTVNQPTYFCQAEQVPYNDETLKLYKEKAAKGNWEGLMLRLDTKYKGKRSNDILKVKNFCTEEYKVQAIETGPMRVISEDSGLEETIETLKSVVIEHKGNEVHVGSGFTIDQRKEYFKDPKKIVGKVISVRYFEETKDSKDGKLSLRFPTFVGLHGSKRST